MQRESTPSEFSAKKAWQTPHVIRRTPVDRTQGGPYIYTGENAYYRPS